MPDLITIQGEVSAILGLTDIPSLQILREGAKRLDDGQGFVTAFADNAAKTAVQGRGLTVTVIKTEAQQEAEAGEILLAISDTPYDFRGIA